MFKNFDICLTYDDVLLLPRVSEISSRKEINLKTSLSKNIKLNIPIVSAPMPSVTEASLAINLARLGGLGIIHRFLPIENQVREVEKVKTAQNVIIRKPVTVKPEDTLEHLLQIKEEYQFSSFLVINEHKKLIGLVTNRDLEYAKEYKKRYVREFMTPRKKIITLRKNSDLKKAKSIMLENRLEKLPIVENDDKVWGLITLKDIILREKYPLASLDSDGNLLVGASIGVQEKDKERAERLYEAGVDVIVIDVAHGGMKKVGEMIKFLKKRLKKVDIVAGNVASAEGAKMLIAAGADGVKVGVGPGSICTTRLVTGVGVPQLSAILDCWKIAKKYKIPLIADGGIRNSGDIVKALAAGANTVMLGNLLAGTEESPGKVVVKNGEKYKVYQGMASLEANLERRDKEIDDLLNINVEGTSGLVKVRGRLEEIIKYLLNGVRSGFSYLGAKNITELRKNAIFVKITEAGRIESKPHDIISGPDGS